MLTPYCASTLKRLVPSKRLQQVGSQLCRRAGSDSDRKLHKPTDAGGEADRLAFFGRPQTDEGNGFFFSFREAGILLNSCSGIHGNTALTFSENAGKSGESRKESGAGRVQRRTRSHTGSFAWFKLGDAVKMELPEQRLAQT